MIGIKCAVVTVMMALSLSNITCKATDIHSNKIVGTVYIGDSRTVGMSNALKYNGVYTENEFFVAKVGKGYNWFIDEALNKVADILNNNSNIDDWNIIINLGINDLHNVNKYINKYNEIINNEYSDYTLYFVSVNPVDEKLCSSIDNNSIEEFNEKIKNNVDCTYIDTFDIVKNSMVTKDGLHYSNNTYINIYEYINTKIYEIKKINTRSLVVKSNKKHKYNKIKI